MQLENLITATLEFQNVQEHAAPNSRQLVTGLNGSARTLYYSALFQETKQSQLIVTDTQYHADQLVEDLTSRLGDEIVFSFPAEDNIAVEIATSSPDAKAARIQALHAMQGEQPTIVVTAVAGLRKFLVPAQVFNAARLHLSFNNEFEMTELQAQLAVMGYVHQPLVEKPGDFAIRGSIVDIYPFELDNPIRIDFFDTEIDSMRFFDVANQRSLASIEEIDLLPVTDFVIDQATFTTGLQKLDNAMSTVRQSLQGAHKKHLTDHFEALLSDRPGERNAELVLYLKSFYDHVASVADYLAADGMLLFDDLTRIQDTEQKILETEGQWVAEQLAKDAILPDMEFGHRLLDIVHNHEQAQILIAQFQKGIGNLKLSNLVQINTRPMQQFFGQMPLLKTEMERWQRQQYSVVIMVNGQERLAQVAATLQDFEITAVIGTPETITEQQVQLIDGQLANGFEVQGARLAVITEAEMFTKVRKKAPKRQTLANAERIKSYSDLKVGDYVVHVNHGIGVYEGMQTLEVHGVHQDYITIVYQKDAKIFIPVSQLNLVQKYTGAEDKTPKINKLGGSDWAKTKRKVTAQIEDIADDLIKLYAEREAARGFAFEPHTAEIQKFEDAFPYTETADQLRSTEEIFRDMERNRPMDRLLVGDVGFGKTEVAFRAAYKAFLDDKQVAILVPTTILAQQHYESMQSRFEEFGVRVGLLSRFQTAKQIKVTLAKLKNHELDMVVGTHRVLSKDVEFADIGLLIIDEEQRFGVKHKERLKELKTNVDVLTLTATPIPRTLHMSMLGVRDLSVIETPPSNRYPIQTYVMEQSGAVIADAIEREMSRDGQIFYLHNRVNDIEKVSAYLNTLVPDARIAYAHGQMSESQLEGIIYDFINGEYDVLVSTTIIETGVDIPNANTLVIENADHMGLAQLYQLRGRVGRSSRVAYAYFTYPQNRVLNEESEKRLEAIRDFTELGSGFKIAMRDLSIRGAGNLLGSKQSGFIDSVGYDLYTQMLNDAVAAKRGDKQTNKTDAEVDLGLEAYLPNEYVNDQAQKIELYKRIRQSETDPQFEEVEDDLLDRFGEYPDQVKNLLRLSRMKVAADHALVEKIKRDGSFIFVTIGKQGVSKIGGPEIFDTVSAGKLSSKFVVAEPNKIEIKLVIQPTMDQEVWLNELELLLAKLQNGIAQPEVANEK
ncbi:transcription-repair coupling factor [Periweissella cryptocerci]|uniref:Transcription-repair-coupling factor n=1 Tax=Periweissella cryptocerci TaxID=2506420 RepID=A0A4V1AJ18_9LACO|nr:transcription-repair coupling factor [Periweissella cryptocerci]